MGILLTRISHRVSMRSSGNMLWVCLLLVYLKMSSGWILKTFRPPRSTPLLSSSSLRMSSPAITVTPLKAMLFLDGTWLFHSLVLGRSAERGDPVALRLGEDWKMRYTLDWTKFPVCVRDQLGEFLMSQRSPRPLVEVARSMAFTSQNLNISTVTDASYQNRQDMIQGWYSANFHVHNYQSITFLNSPEKCVDIAIAVEMLSMAYVPEAYDIAVLVTGDKDYIPALQKCRELGKRVAIVSMRNSCNRDLSRTDANIRDFPMIWIEDFITEMVSSRQDYVDIQDIVDSIVGEVSLCESCRISGRNLGRALQRRIHPKSQVNYKLLLERRGTKLMSLLKEHEGTYFKLESYDEVDNKFDKMISLVDHSPLVQKALARFKMTANSKRLQLIANAASSEDNPEVATTEVYNDVLSNDNVFSEFSSETSRTASSGETMLVTPPEVPVEKKLTRTVVLKKTVRSGAPTSAATEGRGDSVVYRKKQIVLRAIIEIIKATANQKTTLKIISHVLGLRQLKTEEEDGNSSRQSLMDALNTVHTSLAGFVTEHSSVFKVEAMEIVSLLPTSALAAEVTVSDEVRAIMESLIKESKAESSIKAATAKSTSRAFNAPATSATPPPEGVVIALAKLQEICKEHGLNAVGTRRKLLEQLAKQNIDLTQYT